MGGSGIVIIYPNSPELSFDGYNKLTMTGTVTDAIVTWYLDDVEIPQTTGLTLSLTTGGTYRASIARPTVFTVSTTSIFVDRLVIRVVYQYTGIDQFLSIPQGVSQITVHMLSPIPGLNLQRSFVETTIIFSDTSAKTLKIIVGEQADVSLDSVYGGGGGTDGSADNGLVANGAGRTAIQLLHNSAFREIVTAGAGGGMDMSTAIRYHNKRMVNGTGGNGWSGGHGNQTQGGDGGKSDFNNARRAQTAGSGSQFTGGTGYNWSTGLGTRGGNAGWYGGGGGGVTHAYCDAGGGSSWVGRNGTTYLSSTHANYGYGTIDDPSRTYQDTTPRNSIHPDDTTLSLTYLNTIVHLGPTNNNILQISEFNEIGSSIPEKGVIVIKYKY